MFKIGLLSFILIITTSFISLFAYDRQAIDINLKFGSNRYTSDNKSYSSTPIFGFGIDVTIFEMPEIDSFISFSNNIHYQEFSRSQYFVNKTNKTDSLKLVADNIQWYPSFKYSLKTTYFQPYFSVGPLFNYNTVYTDGTSHKTNAVSNTYMELFILNAGINLNIAQSFYIGLSTNNYVNNIKGKIRDNTIKKSYYISDKLQGNQFIINFGAYF